VRSGFDQFGIVFDFLGDGDESVSEEIEFAFAFGFGGLDHERAVDDEREADGIGMEAVIDEAFGDIAGAHAFDGLAVVAENAFVHAGRFIGDFVVRLEQSAEIVGVEKRVHGGAAKAVGTVGHDVSERAD
jgi:hypothetical protein